MIGHPLGHALGHPLGHALGRDNELASGPLPLPVLLGFATPYSSASSTVGTVGRPVVLDTDSLLLVQCSTSAPTNPGSDWTPVLSQTDPNFTQRLDVWIGPAHAVGSQVGQATAGALCGAIIRLRAANGSAVSLLDQAMGSVNGSVNNPEPMQALTPSGLSSALAIGVCSRVNTSGTQAIYTPSSGWTTPYTTALFRMRLALAYRTAVAGKPLSGSFSSNQYSQGTAASWNKAMLTFTKAA